MEPLPSSSLVPVYSETVRVAAKNLKNAIANRQQRLRTKQIENALKWRRVKTGWFRTRPVTLEEATDLVDNERDEYGFLVYDWSLFGKDWVTLADQWLAAYNHSRNDTIYLSVQDARTVAEYVEWKGDDETK